MAMDPSSFRAFLEGELFEVIEKKKGLVRQDKNIYRAELAYLVSMLTRFVDTQYFCQHFTNTPLLDLILRQRSEAPKVALTGLGDFCLFRTGFFPFGFNGRHNMPRENYILAGQKAYSLVFESQNQALEMFRSLALNFPFFSELISEIRLRNMSGKELVQLGELWMETGSEFAQEALRKRGLLPQGARELS